MNRISIAVAAAALCGFAATPLHAQTVSLNAVLNGGNECSGAPPTCMLGDPDGYGVATITIPIQNQICVSVHVSRIDPPTAAHIHQAGPTLNGPVVVPLPAPIVGSPGVSSACVGTSLAFNTSLRNNPGQFYVNVHTAAFPGGAIRGQLF